MNKAENTFFSLLALEDIALKRPGAIKIGPFGSQLKKEDLSERGFKVYGQENIIKGDFSIGDRYVNVRKFFTLKSCELVPGDLIISMMGTIGKCAIFPDDAAKGLMDSHLLRVQIDKDIAEPKFIVKVMTSDDIVGRQVTNMSHGSIMSGLSSGIVRKILLPIPSLKEQRRIAEILDAIDEAIQKTEALIEKLKAMKQGLLHDLLTRGLDENGKLRDPKAHPEQFKDSPFGKVPEEWDTPVFHHLTPDNAPICYGIVQPGPYVDLGVPVVAIQDLNGDYENVHRSSKVVEKNYIRSRIRGWDVLLSVKGSTGRTDIVPEWFEGNISRDVARIRLKNCISSKYVKHMLEWSSFQRYLKNAEVGTTRAEISIGILKRLYLPLPRFREQELIAGVVESQENRIRAEERYLNKLKLQKKGLMRDLLTGRVKINADRPAENQPS
jgi:type I restriction enzyme S subunit